MNQTELKSIETAMRETSSKQLYTRYQVIYYENKSKLPPRGQL